MAPPIKDKRFSMRTVFLVTVVTALVWLLAESRTIRAQRVELTPRLEVGAGSGLVVRPAPGEEFPESVRAVLSGSAAGLDQVLRSLQGRLVLRVGIEAPSTAGIHDIDLREVLQDDETLAAAGVSVLEVSPQRVRVQVDTIEEMSLPVRIEAPEGVLFEANGVPDPNPSSIQVRGPATVLARLAGKEAVVRLDADAVETLAPGRAETIPALTADLPRDDDRWATTFDPPRGLVDVLLTLRSRTASLTLAPMPVQVLLAPGEIGRWSVTLDPGNQDLIGVEVTGPSDQIGLLRSGEVVPTAYIELSFEELERALTEKRAEVQGLPAGVRVAPGTDLMVHLSVQPVPAPAEAGGPPAP